jgi:hypothetical protein
MQARMVIHSNSWLIRYNFLPGDVLKNQDLSICAYLREANFAHADIGQGKRVRETPKNNFFKMPTGHCDWIMSQLS